MRPTPEETSPPFPSDSIPLITHNSPFVPLRFLQCVSILCTHRSPHVRRDNSQLPAPGVSSSPIKGEAGWGSVPPLACGL